ncbi:MAG TPA: hypothetical protein VF546_13980 [Pyrinomonadaceae bacterium]|jgi:hypothetical protein
MAEQLTESRRGAAPPRRDETPCKALALTNSERVALVDAADYDRLSRSRWRLNTHGYAECGSRPGVRLSHAVLGLRGRVAVRHLNGDRLDNRRANLRIMPGGSVSRQPHSRVNPWRVRIDIERAVYFVGAWPTKQRAQEVLRLAARVAADVRGRGLTRAAIQRALDAATGRTARAYASDEAAARLLRAAAALIPTRYTPDVREEAAQAVAADVLAGNVTLAELDRRAVRRYAREALGLRDAYRFRSLDAPAGPGDDRTLAERLAA